ncbi:uncharacterized protein LOC127841780 isoform X1 [Dreissena polymorpha]|uniref:uncharacterized protein LOC127841780 isoform X1 n=2 Tax=Dreissena polymorpha TaxID=45954 RepID=UPI0022643E6B|nr:uncharacterized protein LOC127841780 isoform X1 [Dreissena polymorpha]
MECEQFPIADHMADHFTHTGKDPPSSKIKMNPSTLKVLPPESPVQPDLVPRFEELVFHDSSGGQQDPIDGFVDLNLSNRDHVTTTTHNISSTQSTEGIPNSLPNVVPSGVFGLAFSSYDQDSQQHQEPFYSMPQLRQRLPAGKTFQDGPSLKLFVASCDEDATLKKSSPKQFDASLEEDANKSPPLPACLYSTQEQTAIPEGPKKLYTQEPVKLRKTFEEGKVVLGTTEALRDLVQCYSKLGKTTGVICDEDLNTERDLYEKDVHYIVEKSLGQGSFGTVHLAMDSNRGKKFVLKKVTKASFAKNEVLVPSMLNQTNITRLYGLINRVGLDGEHMELLIEDAGMSLNKYRAMNPQMARRQDVVWDFCKQGCRALEHMDKFGIIHQDIKPENVCLTDQGDGFVNMKITDFGSAKFAHDPMHFVGLTPEYLSPEVCKLVLQMRYKQLNFGLSDDDITGKSDIFAFALVVMFLYKGYHILQHVLTNGQSSYEAYTPEQRQSLHMSMIVQVAQGENFVQTFIPDECSPDMRLFLHKMLEFNPVERLSAREALQSIEGLDQQVAHDKQRMERMRVKPAMSKLEMPSLVGDQAGHGFVPEIAEELMVSDHGPVKSATKDRLRKMIADPYTRGGKGIADPYTRGAKGSGKGRTTPVTSVMTPRHVASKKMHMYPMTDAKEIVGVTERNAPIAQPSADNDSPMDMAASPMIDIRKGPKPATPQFVYQQPRRPIQRTTSDATQVDCRQNAMQVDCRQNAMEMDCGQMASARTPQQCQVTEAHWQTNQTLRQLTEMLKGGGRQVTGLVLEQVKQMLRDNQQRDMFMQNVRQAGNTTETEQNGPLDHSQVPRFDKIFF